ncbi:hypothetical protein Fmac_004101 [Flemingia macrophylla]|uniref:Zinc finger ZPR1-type domain-containing protein n=1 Tax=Flemingia macrophylla TaxID=520843 RepID=A0ABD1N424_9FABA
MSEKMEGNGEQIVDVGSVVEAISADDGDAPLYNFESLCMRCGENVLSLPLFRHHLLFSFDELHKRFWRWGKGWWLFFIGVSRLLAALSIELEIITDFSIGAPTPLSAMSKLRCLTPIPELDFQIPPEAHCGSLSTVEGILMRVANELQALQEERKRVTPETAEAIDQFLVKLKACATGESAFTFILDDPAGNSFIENPFAPSSDPSLTIKFYERTCEQQASLGYLVDSTQIEGTHEAPEGSEAETTHQVRREPHGSIGATAGHRPIAQSNSSEISEALFWYTAPEELCIAELYMPVPLNVRLECLLPSDTASVKVPELDLELASGTLGGIVTTVEGLITKISEKGHGFTFGDSLDEHMKSKWIAFKARLNKLLSLEEAWTLVLNDALANSFVVPATHDPKNDNHLAFEEYERSWEENEELGLNDMDTSSADVAYESTNTKTD